MRFLIWIVPLGWCLHLSGASFYEAPPPGLMEQLQPQLPAITQALAGDPDLIQEAGAHSATDLSQARLDFSKTVRFFDLDHRALDRAASFQDLMVATPSYSVPICVAKTCATMALVDWNPETKTAKLRYVGRSVQQQAIQSAARRIADAPGERSARLVSPDILNFAFVPEANGPGYLISATPEQEAELAEMIGHRLSAKKGGPWKMTLAEYQAVSEVRAKAYEVSHLDEYRTPEIAEGESLEKDSPSPSKEEAPTPSQTQESPTAPPPQASDSKRARKPLVGALLLAGLVLAWIIRRVRRG